MNMMKVAVHQPTFLPWVGFFNKLAHADVFIIMAGVDWSSGDYLNRCKINGGWVTIPHARMPGEARPISEVEYTDERLIRKAVEGIKQSVFGRRIPFKARAQSVLAVLEEIQPGSSLTEVNVRLVRAMADAADLPARIVVDTTRPVPEETKTQRLVSTIRRNVLGPVHYYSGASGKDYLVADELPEGIDVSLQQVMPHMPDGSFLVELVSDVDPHSLARGCATWSSL